MTDAALLSDDDIFGGSPLLSDADIFGADAAPKVATETGSLLSKAGNIAAGVGERVGDLGGGLVRAATGVVDEIGRGIRRGGVAAEERRRELGRELPSWLVDSENARAVRGQTQEAISSEGETSIAKAGGGLAKKLEATDFGYEPATTWEDVKVSPLKQFIPFALEQGLISLPDAAAAIAALPAYVAARTGEMGQERAKNEGVENARVDDLLKVLPAAVASSLLERLGARGMFGLDDATGGVMTRAAKAGVKEAGTEAAQESVEYTGTNLGTREGFDPSEMGERALAGAVAGGTFGAALGGSVAAGERAFGGKQPGTILSDQDIFTDAPEVAPSQDGPAAVIPQQRRETAAPVDRERANSPRLTPEDRASPIPNDLIDDGKALIEAATQKEGGATLEPAPAAPVTQPSVEERAVLRKAGSMDDEIDAMSVEERQAEVAQARQSGVVVSDEEFFAAQPAPVATQAAQERIEAPAPSSPAPIAETPVAPPVETPAVSQAPDAPPRIERQPIARRDMDQDVAVTASGREVPVRYAVVEAGSLIASQRDDGGASPDFPADMQPRDRDRAASQLQIQNIASSPNPRLLDKSPRASDGAPIIAPDGVVESGNGRVLGLRRAYASGSAEGYRQYLAERGYPVDGMTQPVLVRVREGELSPADRQAFTREANERDNLAMSATEQAMADAAAMSDNLLALYRGGDVDQASNRDFVRAFIRDVVGQNEQGRMIGADGALSQEAVRRVQAGLLGKAYGDAELVSSLVESTDTNIKAIGGALMDVAADWAQMRAEAKAGTISPDVDLTANLLEAVRVVSRARREGRQVAEYVGQTDIFSGTAVSPEAVIFLRLMFRNRISWTMPAGRDRFADTLRHYVEEARKTSAGVDLLGETATEPKAIIAAAERRQDGRSDDKQAGLDFKAPAVDPARQNDRPHGRDRAVEAEPRPNAEGRNDAPRDGGQTASEVTLKAQARPSINFAIGPYPREGKRPMARNARDYLLAKGRREGVEFLVAFDAGGGVLAHQRGTKDNTLMTPELERALLDPGSDMVVHHNHPRSTSLSNVDISFLAFPGLASVWAHGHDGRSSQASLTPAALKVVRAGMSKDDLYEAINTEGIPDVVQRLLSERIIANVPEARVAESLARMAALNRANLIDWNTSIPFPTYWSDPRLQSAIERAADATSAAIFGKADTRRDDRSPVAFRHIGDMGIALEGSGEVPGRGSDEDGPDAGGPSRDSGEEDRKVGFREETSRLTERARVLDTQGIPRVKAVTASLGRSIMRSIKRGKDDGESLSDYTHRKLIDYLQPLKVMIEKAGGAPQEMMDVYLMARLAEDASLARIQKIHDQHVTPMVEELAKGGATLEDLHKYAYAMHAEERNRVVGLRNEPDSEFYRAVKDPTIKGASGWSTNEAKKVLREFQADPKQGTVSRAYRRLREMIDQSLLDQKKAGLISAETYDTLTSQWQNYVPLRSEEGDNDGLPGRGSGFDVRGKEFNGATGRTTEAENITVWAIAAAERAVLRAEKNAVGKAMLRFINYADPNGETLAKVYWSDDAPLMDIEKAAPVYRRELKDGKVVNRKVPPATISPSMFAVKVGGKNYYVEFADEKVGLALKKLGQTEMNALFHLLRKASVWQSLINTRLNPAFTPINILRDAMTGSIHLLDENFTVAGSAKVLASIPKAWGAIWRDARGKAKDGAWDAAMAEYKAAGGKITFDNYKSMEETLSTLQKHLSAAARGKNPTRAAWDTFAKFIGDVTDAGENGIRLATFKAARDKGMTSKRAAFLARDLTVDFKKKGEIGPQLNAWSAFFNASLQGG